VERLLNAGTGVCVNAYRLGRLREKRIHRWRRLSYRRRLHDGTCAAVRWRRFGSHFRFSSPDEGRYKLEMPERAAVSAISALLATAFLALQAMAPSCDRDNIVGSPAARDSCDATLRPRAANLQAPPSALQMGNSDPGQRFNRAPG
jgi:hypothetical protein